MEKNMKIENHYPESYLEVVTAYSGLLFFLNFLFLKYTLMESHKNSWEVLCLLCPDSLNIYNCSQYQKQETDIDIGKDLI